MQFSALISQLKIEEHLRLVDNWMESGFDVVHAIKRLVEIGAEAGKAHKNTSNFDLKELKEMASHLGIPKTKCKSDLVDSIIAKALSKEGGDVLLAEDPGFGSASGSASGSGFASRTQANQHGLNPDTTVEDDMNEIMDFVEDPYHGGFELEEESAVAVESTTNIPTTVIPQYKANEYINNLTLLCNLVLNSSGSSLASTFRASVNMARSALPPFAPHDTNSIYTTRSEYVDYSVGTVIDETSRALDFMWSYRLALFRVQECYVRGLGDSNLQKAVMKTVEDDIPTCYNPLSAYDLKAEQMAERAMCTLDQTTRVEIGTKMLYYLNYHLSNGLVPRFQAHDF